MSDTYTDTGIEPSESRRRRQALGDSVAQVMRWTAFATFTFDDNRTLHAPYPPGPQVRGPLHHGWRVSNRGDTLASTHLSDSAAWRKLEQYLVDLEDLLGTIHGVFALEHQKVSRPHFHGMIQAQGDPCRVAESMAALWQASYGLARVEVPDHVNRASTYAFKEVALGEASFATWRVGTLKRRRHPKPTRGPARLEICP